MFSINDEKKISPKILPRWPLFSSLNRAPIMVFKSEIGQWHVQTNDLSHQSAERFVQNYRYGFGPQKLNWKSGIANQGSHLATVTSQEEQEWLQKNCKWKLGLAWWAERVLLWWLAMVYWQTMGYRKSLERLLWWNIFWLFGCGNIWGLVW